MAARNTSSAFGAAVIVEVVGQDGVLCAFKFPAAVMLYECVNEILSVSFSNDGPGVPLWRRHIYRQLTGERIKAARLQKTFFHNDRKYMVFGINLGSQDSSSSPRLDECLSDAFIIDAEPLGQFLLPI